MHIIAVHQMQGEESFLAKELATALGITPYEAKPRVSVPGGGPAVVARFAAVEAAEACAAQLRAAGFSVIVLDAATEAQGQAPLIVHRLFLGEHALEVFDHQGQTLALPYQTVTLLLSGIGISSTTRIETKKERKFSLGRTVATGGLVMSKKKQVVTEHSEEDRQPFCQLFASDCPPLLLRQASMDFQTFDSEIKPTREANFSWLCAELRRRCPSARWDARLQTRAGQTQLLGPGLAPEQHLDLAIRLIALTG